MVNSVKELHVNVTFGFLQAYDKIRNLCMPQASHVILISQFHTSLCRKLYTRQVNIIYYTWKSLQHTEKLNL
jgi:hypothetical protein